VRLNDRSLAVFVESKTSPAALIGWPRNMVPMVRAFALECARTGVGGGAICSARALKITRDAMNCDPAAAKDFLSSFSRLNYAGLVKRVDYLYLDDGRDDGDFPAYDLADEALARVESDGLFLHPEKGEFVWVTERDRHYKFILTDEVKDELTALLAAEKAASEAAAKKDAAALAADIAELTGYIDALRRFTRGPYFGTGYDKPLHALNFADLLSRVRDRLSKEKI
jgi:hypothetical protein